MKSIVFYYSNIYQVFQSVQPKTTKLSLALDFQVGKTNATVLIASKL